MPDLPPPKRYADLPPWADDEDTVRKRIVNAAWNALFTRDLTQISFRDLAFEVGVTTPAFYRHFPTLHDLGEELLKASGASLREAMTDAHQKHRSPRASFQTMFRFAANRPNHFALMLAPQYRDGERMKFTRKRFLEDFKFMLEVDAGRKVNEADGRTLWAVLWGAASLVAAGEMNERQAMNAIKPALDALSRKKR